MPPPRRRRTATTRSSPTGTTPFQAPPFAAIRSRAFRPGLRHGARRAIGARSRRSPAEAATPTFDNTIAALERSGRALSRVSAVFFALVGAHSNDALLGIERDIVPRLAAHWDAIYMNQALFGGSRRCGATRAGLDAEQARVLDRYFVTFRRAGAGLDAAARAAARRDRRAAGRRSAPDSASACWPTSRATRCRSTPRTISRACRSTCARRPAKPRRNAAWQARPRSRWRARASSRSCNSRARRDLREKAFRAWIARGEGGADRQPAGHRRDGAAAHREGAACSAIRPGPHYRLDDAMAKTPEAARGLLSKVWAPARRRALADRDAMQEMIRAEGGNFALAPWDWRYYAEKLRQERCDLDEGEIEPYLQLDRMIAAAFETARRLFGITVDAAQRRAGLASGRARLGGAGSRRAPSRPVLRRLFRPAVQAQRRLDDDAARAGQARRRGPAAGVQRHELLQGRRRRADAAQLRRRPHAVPRVRPRAACAAVGRDLSADLRHRGARPISSSCRRSSTSIGWRRPRSSSPSPSTTAPASRCRTR